jgi:hypothetical protein
MNRSTVLQEFDSHGYSTIATADGSPAIEQLEARIYQLEEERDHLQELVCHLLRKAERLRHRLHCKTEEPG